MTAVLPSRTGLLRARPIGSSGSSAKRDTLTADRAAYRRSACKRSRSRAATHVRCRAAQNQPIPHTADPSPPKASRPSPRRDDTGRAAGPLTAAARGPNVRSMLRRCVRPSALRLAASAVAALAAAACHSLDPLTQEGNARLETFDFVWQTLADDYPMFGDRLVDWNEVRTRCRAAVPFARAPHEFHHLLTGMLGELGDLHVSLQIPRAQFAPPGVPVTSLLDQPDFAVMPIEGRLHVVRWPDGMAPTPPDGIAAATPCPELWRVNGFPVVLSLVDNLLLGPAGSPVELQLRWANGVVTRTSMRRPATADGGRKRLFAHLDPDDGTTRAQDRSMPWLEVRSFSDRKDIDTAERLLGAADPGPGLVLDLRRNQGGRFQLAQQLVERFLREPIELVFVPKEPVVSYLGLFDVEFFVVDSWQPRAPAIVQPLVVLTSSLTGSAAEHAARILQRHCGAVVVGERTAGAEAVVQEATCPNGAVLRFGSTRVVDRTGVGLQREGVVPDVSVRLTVADVEAAGAEAAQAAWERRLESAARQALRRRGGR